ncbi:MAG: NAD+ synthase [Anaerolineae bacterium]
MSLEQVAERISQWIADQVRRAGARGGVLGVSGGVDSALVAALTAKALPGRALGVLMPCHSQPEDEEWGRLVLQTFGLEALRVDLTPAYDALVGCLPPGSDLARANLKPRLRMATLYYLANAHNYLVIGSGNKSELMVGYFTKFGDGGVDLLPIGGLYKHQVRALARAVGVPQPIVERPPTAGLWPGQTDEGEMGISYEDLDAVLAALEAGEVGHLDAGLVERVRAMQARSEHKRRMPPICPVEWPAILG